MMRLLDRYLIEIEQEEGGLWKWRYVDSTDGADRYSAERFTSRAECEKAATEFIYKYESKVTKAENRLRGMHCIPVSDSLN